MDASQGTVFASVIPLLRSALAGFNATIFAYGQTGTGKTYTMLGHDLFALASERSQTTAANNSNQNSNRSDNDEIGERGIIPRTLQYVFSQIEALYTHQITISISYTEIYCEKIKDLLADPLLPRQSSGGTMSANEHAILAAAAQAHAAPLDIFEDKELGMHIPNLTEVRLSISLFVFVSAMLYSFFLTLS
jgi:hypothetical protein